MRTMKLLACLVALVLLAGCANPNAYRKRNKMGFGYTGEFGEGRRFANAGYASFVGGADISDTDLGDKVLRRASELCRDSGYDYYFVVRGENYSTTGLKQESRYWGRSTDAYGNVYNRYKVWTHKVPARGVTVSFMAYRGPMPPGDYVAVSRTGDGADATCPHCGKYVQSVTHPGVCPYCKGRLFRDVRCPNCNATNVVSKPGPIVCRKCGIGFRVADCGECRVRHSVSDFRAFACTHCSTNVPAEQRPGDFPCPFCGWQMVWPAELHGDYRCDGCRRTFTLKRCPKCSTPVPTRTTTAFRCPKCNYTVRPPRPSR